MTNRDPLSVVVFDADLDAPLGSVALPVWLGDVPCYTAAFGDCVITSDRTLGFVTTCEQNVWVIDLTSSPPSLASGTNPIPISNFGQDLALTDDDCYLLVATHWFLGDPVSVVEVASRSEVNTFGGHLNWNSIDVDPAGSMLVTCESGNRRVQRWVIDALGNISDTGETLLLGTGLVRDVAFVPGSTYALLVQYGAIKSFQTPGLALVDSDDAVLGFDVLPDPLADRVYLRGFDRLEAYSFDRSTAEVSDDPLWSIRSSVFSWGCCGTDEIALHPDGSKLYTPTRNLATRFTRPERPRPRGGVWVLDPATGARLGRIHHPDFDGDFGPEGICVR